MLQVMLVFEKVNEDNVLKLRPFFDMKKARFCDFTVGIVYIWRHVFRIEYCIHCDTLIMKIDYGDHKTCFYYPVGENTDEAFKAIREYALVNKNGLEFCGLTKDEVSDLQKRFPQNKVFSHRDWCDYLYDIADHVSFSGKTLANKRNLFNRFCSDYPQHHFREAEQSDDPRVDDFYDRYEATLLTPSTNLLVEIKETRRLFSIRSSLGLRGFLIEIDGIIVGVSLIEIVGDILFVHVEKAISSFNGIYQALVHYVANEFKDSVKYINREEDDGVEGLRKSKLQYKPVELLSKNFFIVCNNITLINSLPNLQTPRLILTALETQYQDDYYNMVIDDQLNEFWGYDYRSDLNSNVLTSDYLYNEVKNDLRTNSNFSLIIIDKMTKDFLGEIVLHNFNDRNHVEIGIRLITPQQGKGYARESMNAVLNYLFEEIGISSVFANCYKENKSSQNLFLSLGFKQLDSDTKKHYFRLDNRLVN